MSWFDEITQKLDQALRGREGSFGLTRDEDTGHFELMADASRRASAVHQAVREGRLDADVSSRVNARSDDAARYDAMLREGGFASRAQVSMGAVSNHTPRSWRSHISMPSAENGKPAGVSR